MNRNETTVGQNETLLVPATATATRLTALASAAAGDPTPFEGTIMVPLAPFTRRCWIGAGSFGDSFGDALAVALEDFTSGAWDVARLG